MHQPLAAGLYLISSVCMVETGKQCSSWQRSRSKDRIVPGRRSVPTQHYV